MQKKILKKYFRNYKKVEKGMIMPYLGFGYQPGTGIRTDAIMEVLRRLPEKDYKKLERKSTDNEFQWFIPPYDLLGEVYPFTSNIFDEKKDRFKLMPYAKVLFLSPILEEKNFDIVTAVTAHELAHIILGHKTVFVDDKTYKTQERTAWNKVIEWGFKKEEKKYRKETNKS